MTDLRISVVICAYSEARWNDLASAVASVRSQAYPAHETIVVVDHNPSLLARAREQMKEAVAVENTDGRGLSGARNSGIAIAGGDVIAFLDDDAVAAPDWLGRLAEKYADPRVIGVGGSIEPLWERNRPRWFPEEFDWVVGCTYRGMPHKEGDVRNLIGCNMSFQRGVFQQTGGFRTGFGQVGASMLRCDETEFCIRVRQNDPAHRLSFAPSAHVFHHVPSDRAHWSYFQSRCFTEGMAKASLSQLLGARDGLSSERAYALSALPRAILRELANVVRHRDPYGLARASAITAGLGLTAAGYLYGSLSIRFAPLAQTRGSSQSSEGHNPSQASARITPANGA
jgi:GT2 family glycosyltransferase